MGPCSDVMGGPPPWLTPPTTPQDQRAAVLSLSLPQGLRVGLGLGRGQGSVVGLEVPVLGLSVGGEGQGPVTLRAQGLALALSAFPQHMHYLTATDAIPLNPSASVWALCERGSHVALTLKTLDAGRQHP